MVFETAPHTHSTRMNKAELAAHLAIPHRQADGGWRSIATPVSAIRKWRLDEIERTHAEFHGDLR